MILLTYTISVTPDDKVASGQSNRKGYFYVNGSRNELTGLDLYFQVEGAAAASNCKNVGTINYSIWLYQIISSSF